MSQIEVRISGVSSRTESICERLPFSVVEQGDVVVRSQLKSSSSLNEHLVWLWGMLKPQRKFLKDLQQQGGTIVCRCKFPSSDIHLLPNGAEMLHLLNMELVIEKRSSVVSKS